MFVPYMDPSEEWYYKSYFDSGEYGFGLFAVSLKHFADCPANAVFLDAYFSTNDGTPAKLSNAFFIFENHAGNIMWHHTESSIPRKVVSDFFCDCCYCCYIVVLFDIIWYCSLQKLGQR